MSSSKGRRRDADAPAGPTSALCPELQRLIQAQATLDHARRNAKWKRECKNLQSASHAVQVAALAAHDAGIGWAEIGDVLGIERAMPQSTAPAVAPEPLPQQPEPEPAPAAALDISRHRTQHVVAATVHHFPENRQSVAG